MRPREVWGRFSPVLIRKLTVSFPPNSVGPNIAPLMFTARRSTDVHCAGLVDPAIWRGLGVERDVVALWIAARMRAFHFPLLRHAHVVRGFAALAPHHEGSGGVADQGRFAGVEERTERVGAACI